MTHLPLIILYVIYLVFLYRREKAIFIYSLFLSLIVLFLYLIFVLRYQSFNELENLKGIIVSKSDKWILIKRRNIYIKCYTSNAKDFKIGKRISFSISNRDSYIRNVSGTYNYYKYLLSNGIMKEGNLKSYSIKEKSFSLYLIRGKIIDYLESSFSSQTSMYLKRLILGINEFSEEMNNDIDKIGIIYLFCISGLHVSLLTEMIRKVMEKLGVMIEIESVLIISFLLLYSLITLNQSSISRAVNVLVFKEMLTLFNKRISKCDTLFLSFMFQVIKNPFILFQIGFYLTYLSTFIIYVLEKKNYLKISLSVMMFNIPLILYSNGEISLFLIFYSIVFNVFFSELFIPLSYIVFMFPPLDFLYSFITRGLDVVIESTGNLNMPISYSVSNVFFLVLIYLIMFLIYRKPKWKIRRYRLYGMLVFIVLTDFFISRYAFIPTVEMIDVGQGDSFLLRSGFKTVLIDTGVEDKYETTINHLKSKNIRKIDYLFLSHLDSDHSGESENIINKMNVKNVYMSLNDIHMDIGEFKIDFISLNSSDENEGSMVMYVVVRGVSFLFTGDIEDEGEANLLKSGISNVDFLKIAHHGSDTSSSKELVRRMNPKVSLISVGLNNRYHHPKDVVIKRLEDINSTIYRTDLDGSVLINVYGPFSIIRTYKHNWLLPHQRFEKVKAIKD